MVAAMARQIAQMPLPAGVVAADRLSTVYFGGGTPSLLGLPALAQLMAAIGQRFTLDPDAEITLETNPDDMTTEKLLGWQQLGINRHPY